MADLERAPVSQVRQLLELACSEADPELLEELEDLLHLLAQGERPAARLAQLVDWLPAWEQIPEDVGLEAELRELAARLPRDQWHTLTYDEIEQAVGHFRLGDGEPLQDAVGQVRDRLAQAWESYETMPVAPAEITVETVVGHRLLEEAFAGWFQALDWLELPEPPWKDALGSAEAANRLLIVVQRHAARVQAQAG